MKNSMGLFLGLLWDFYVLTKVPLIIIIPFSENIGNLGIMITWV